MFIGAYSLAYYIYNAKDLILVKYFWLMMITSKILHCEIIIAQLLSITQLVPVIWCEESITRCQSHLMNSLYVVWRRQDEVRFQKIR